MKKITVTGAAGLIGRSVIKNLLNRNHNYHINAIDIVEDSLFKDLDEKRFIYYKGNCRDFEFIDSIISKSDAVIHLAAPASFLMYKEDPIKSTMNTVESFLNIMESMKKHNVQKIVHASTSAVYEGHPVPYSESMQIDPPDLKALSKKVNEEIGEQYARSYGITSIAMRPFSVYGDYEGKKGGYANITSLFVWAMISGEIPVVWGDGKQTRDFIHADDVAEAFALALEKDIKTQPLNVGIGIETSFNEVIELINNILKKQSKPRYVPIPIDIYAIRLLSDNKQVEKVLGFKPKISLQEGLERMIATAKVKIKKEKELAKKQMYFETLR